MTVRLNKKEEWVAWMHGLGKKDVQWVYPWWNFSDICSRSFHTYVALAGLRQCSFYHPSRIARQQGLKQHPTHMPYLPNVGALTKSFIEAITHSWPRRVMLHHIHRNQDFSST